MLLDLNMFFSLQIRLATADISFGILELGQFQLNTVGTLMKIIYAFLWQVILNIKILLLNALNNPLLGICPDRQRYLP